MGEHNYYVPKPNNRRRKKRKNRNRMLAVLSTLVILLLLTSIGDDTATPAPTSSPVVIATPIPTPESSAVPTTVPTAAPQTSTDIQVLSQLGLPIPDENGKTTYTGQVGYQFDADGNALIESLFDQSVIEIEALDWVDDACIVVEDGSILIVIMTNAALNDETVKDLVDSAIRRLSSTVSWFSEYTSPSRDNYGSLYDDYFLTVGVFASSSQKQMAKCTKAKLSNTLRWK